MKMQIQIARTAQGEYRAWCPRLPGCQVRSSSLPQAQQKLTEAARGYLASLNMAANEVEFETLTPELLQAR
jgi:predicted RNase H-like HicB family nuclease